MHGVQSRVWAILYFSITAMDIGDEGARAAAYRATQLRRATALRTQCLTLAGSSVARAALALKWEAVLVDRTTVTEVATDGDEKEDRRAC